MRYMIVKDKNGPVGEKESCILYSEPFRLSLWVDEFDVLSYGNVEVDLSNGPTLYCISIPHSRRKIDEEIIRHHLCIG